MIPSFMMIRAIATVGLIVCLFASLQSYSDYWVMRKITCPVEDVKIPRGCTAQAKTCSAQPAAEESRSCCGRSDDYVDPPDATRCAGVADAACIPVPCPDPVQKAKCCVLVHLFLTDLPVRLAFSPETFSSSVTHSKHELPTSQYVLSPKEYIPPWGIHPDISSTVLRI